jgi:hypothetical protein
VNPRIPTDSDTGRDNDGGGLAKGGQASLHYDRQAVGTGHVERIIPTSFAADEDAM